MKLDNQAKIGAYLSVLAVLTIFLIREYTYIHPFNTGYFLLGPKWQYASTRTFTWWYLLVSSVIMMLPLLRKQKIGFLGLLLLCLVFIRPFIQYKFPNETAVEFYKDREVELNQIVKNYRNDRNRIIVTKEIKNLGFESLQVRGGTYYFMVCDEDFPFGVCYNAKSNFQTNDFDRNIEYTKIDANWSEFDF